MWWLGAVPLKYLLTRNSSILSTSSSIYGMVQTKHRTSFKSQSQQCARKWLISSRRQEQKLSISLRRTLQSSWKNSILRRQQRPMMLMVELRAGMISASWLRRRKRSVRQQFGGGLLSISRKQTSSSEMEGSLARQVQQARQKRTNHCSLLSSVNLRLMTSSISSSAASTSGWYAPSMSEACMMTSSLTMDSRLSMSCSLLMRSFMSLQGFLELAMCLLTISVYLSGRRPLCLMPVSWRIRLTSSSNCNLLRGERRDLINCICTESAITLNIVIILQINVLLSRYIQKQRDFCSDVIALQKYVSRWL